MDNPSVYAGLKTNLKRVAGRLCPPALRTALQERRRLEGETRPVAVSGAKDPDLRTIVILDTMVNDSNLGNNIIMEACYRTIRSMFPDDFVYHVPAQEYVTAGRSMLQRADHIFLGGSNLLATNMDQTSEWRVRLEDADWYHNVMMLGIGWWQYQAGELNKYTRQLFDRVLHRTGIHSTRDGYTATWLRRLGFNAINTGCPSMWQLTPEHCREIPQHKADDALITFTEYKQDPRADRELFETVRRNYDKVYFWPQQYGDYAYAKHICEGKVNMISPSLEALGELLATTQIDYIGTRLHGGIRAMQYQRRSIIITVDNRGIEMGRDFGLPTLPREEIEEKLQRRIHSTWATQVSIDERAIEFWKSQFAQTMLATA